MLEEVSGKPRRAILQSNGPYAEAVLASKPVAYWRMEDMNAPKALDASGQNHHGQYEDLIALYLDGPGHNSYSGIGKRNRAAHFAGGRLRSRNQTLTGSNYSVELLLWSGLPADDSDTLGYVLARESEGKQGDRLSIGGPDNRRNCLMFSAAGLEQPLFGHLQLHSQGWHHVALVREKEMVRVYLDSALLIEGRAPEASATGEFFVGGSQDNSVPFEGKIDEVSIYDRALSGDELLNHRHIAAKTVEK